MSLFYPPSKQVYRGKTSEREDRFTARFVELTPPSESSKRFRLIRWIPPSWGDDHDNHV